MPYKSYLPKLGPTWFQGARGAALLSGIGAQLDAGRDAIRYATRARMPVLADADGIDGAVDQGGRDRQLERAVGESDADYAIRQREAFEIWATAGTHRGLLIALKRAGFQVGGHADTDPHEDTTTIVQFNGRFAQLNDDEDVIFGDLGDCETRVNLLGALDPKPGWVFHAAETQWAAFGIVFPQAVTINSVALANAEGNAPKAKLNDIVRKWKPAKAFYVGAWLVAGVDDIPSWGWPPPVIAADPGVWGASGKNWGGSTSTKIDPE